MAALEELLRSARAALRVDHVAGALANIDHLRRPGLCWLKAAGSDDAPAMGDAPPRAVTCWWLRQLVTLRYGVTLRSS